MIETYHYSNNRAFHSLSFRGAKGYANNPITRSINRSKQPRSKTYGAIMCIKDESGQGQGDLYALVRGSYTGKWSFPKGHSNEGEEPIQCTMREVGEETGIDYLPPPSNFMKLGFGNYFVFYLTDQILLKPRDTHEIMDTKWVTLEEMEDMPINADVSLYRKRCLNMM